MGGGPDPAQSAVAHREPGTLTSGGPGTVGSPQMGRAFGGPENPHDLPQFDPSNMTHQALYQGLLARQEIFRLRNRVTPHIVGLGQVQREIGDQVAMLWQLAQYQAQALDFVHDQVQSFCLETAGVAQSLGSLQNFAGQSMETLRTLWNERVYIRGVAQEAARGVMETKPRWMPFELKPKLLMRGSVSGLTSWRERWPGLVPKRSKPGQKKNKPGSNSGKPRTSLQTCRINSRSSSPG